MTDRQTNHTTRSVTIDRIYVRSTAMRSKKRVKDEEVNGQGGKGERGALAPCGAAPLAIQKTN